MLMKKQVHEVNKLVSLFDHTIILMYISKKIVHHKYVEL
jgi:hypothetical protein